MAEFTRCRNNVLGYPIYGLPYTVVFPILDEDGDPVTGLTCDSEISKNGNTAVDCHNEGVEIAFDTATNKGMYYLDLTGAHTGTEMAADVVAVTIYGGATTAQATPIVLYPKHLPVILTGTVGATGNDTTHVHIPDGVAINDFYNGCVLHMKDAANDECRMIIDYVASTKLATLSSALDAAPTASTSLYDVYLTDVAVANLLALQVGMIPNAVAGASGGIAILGSKMDLQDAPNATAITAINLAISNKIGTPQDLGNGTATLAGNLSDIDSETDLIYGAVQGIGTAGGAAISIDAAGDNYGGGITGVTSGTTKAGTETGTYANASNVNAVYHIMTHAAQVVDIVYQFLTGGGTSPVGVRWTGILNPNGDAATVYAWNHVLNDWESIGSIAGQASTTVNVAKTFVLYARHRGTSAAELGKVYIRIASSAAYNHIVRTDQIIVDYAVTSQVTQGKVYINTATGTDGYDTGYNGIAGHPVKTIACALALCVAVGVKDIEVATGSTITLGASVAGYNFRGQYWTLALGNQNIAGAYFYGANVSGVSSGVDAWFDHCVIGTATIAQAFLELCLFAGTFTTVASGNYSIINGLDGIPGETNAVFVLTANTILGIRNWSGGININAMAATNVVVLDGRGKLILDSNNVAGEIRVRGNWDITDNVEGGFAGTLTKTANMNTSSPLTIAAGQYVNITRPTGAVVSGEGTSVTNFKTNLTSSEDDYIKDAYLKFISGENYNQVKKISAYNGSTKYVTTLAFTNVPQVDDAFVIINE